MEAQKINPRLLSMKVVGGKRAVQQRKRNQSLYNTDDRTENSEILQRASNYYMGLDAWREMVKRNWRYRKGEQWSDLIYDPDSASYIKEEELIKAQGQIPFVVNMISPLIENIIGQFRSSRVRPTVRARTRESAPVSEMLTNTLWDIEDSNMMWSLDTAALEMMLHSAVVVNRADCKSNRERKRKEIDWENTDLMSVFFNQPTDQKYRDITMIGQIHDMSISAVVSMFAKTREDEKVIRNMFSHVDKDAVSGYDSFSSDQIMNKDFFFPADPAKCRVIEVWEKRGEWRYEYHDWAKAEVGSVKLNTANKVRFDKENAARIELALQYGEDPEEVSVIDYEEKYVEFWYYKYITHDYYTLMEGESPFEHGSHPYVLMFHRMNMGEVIPFTSSLIDIQRGYNRDRILLDFVIGASAKGTFYIDEKHLGKDFTVDKATAEYTKRNGVIKLDLKNGAKVSDVLGQLTSKAMPAGLNESLAMGMKLMQQMGGISDALQGRSPGAGTPASLYAQSAQNSTLNIKDRLEAFNDFRARRGKRLIDLALQYYEDKRYLTVNGNSETKEFDRAKVKDDLKYDTTMAGGSDSQIYRSIMDDWISQYISQGIVPLEVGLKNLSFPGIDKLLTDLEEFKKAQAQGAVMPDGTAVEPGQVPQPPQIAEGLMDSIRGAGADENAANQNAMELMSRYFDQAS